MCLDAAFAAASEEFNYTAIRHCLNIKLHSRTRNSPFYPKLTTWQVLWVLSDVSKLLTSTTTCNASPRIIFHVIEKLENLWLNIEHNYEMRKQALRSRVLFETTKSQTLSRNYEHFMKPENYYNV